jgi:hypothetical protein
MATTTNFGWTTPNDSDPFKDGALAIRTLGSSIDTTVNAFSRGRVLVVVNTNTTALVAGTELTICTGSATIVPGRRYEFTGTCAIQAGASGSGVRTAWMNETSQSLNRTFSYDTTAIGANLNYSHSGVTTFTAAEVGVTTGSGTAKTFNFKVRQGSAGSLSTNPDSIIGANSFPQVMIIKDIGPA